MPIMLLSLRSLRSDREEDDRLFFELLPERLDEEEGDRLDEDEEEDDEEEEEDRERLDELRVSFSSAGLLSLRLSERGSAAAGASDFSGFSRRGISFWRSFSTASKYFSSRGTQIV